MSVLERISSPADVKALRADDVSALADEIRGFLVESVSRTGGHLGPNLGVVELSIALHRVFDSPRDTIVFDTGHQSYVHKLLTGRHDFSRLKKKGGLSGYPSREESAHDVVENSHASGSLSWAEGIAKGRALRGERGRHTVAVIGDGALTGGMAWEALNNIAVAKDLPLTIVVNDNERSYAPTIGGLAEHLAVLRTTQGYEKFLEWGKSTIRQTPVVGRQMYETLHGVKKGLKDIVAPQGMFEDLGLKYIGPVDGHDEPAVEKALRLAREFGGPCIVHVLTQKGHGYAPAMEDEADQFHGVGKFNPETGLPFEVAGRIWTDEFSDEMVQLGREREDIVAITAAMLIPVGLAAFKAEFPERVIDVGIAEQHALTLASGLSFAGLHPVVALYSTFLNRAFDQLLMDAALHQQGLTLVLDRAGITGSDGPSHNGMWDMAISSIVPGLRLAAPRDGQQVRTQLREAVAVTNAPTVVRFPKGDVGPAVEAVRQLGTTDVLFETGTDDEVDLVIVGVGVFASTAVDAGEKLAAQGHSVRVIDPRWVLPVGGDTLAACAGAGAVAVIEDNLETHGIGMAMTHALRGADYAGPVHVRGIPKRFLEHASRKEIIEELGLTADAIATDLAARLA